MSTTIGATGGDKGGITARPGPSAAVQLVSGDNLTSLAEQGSIARGEFRASLRRLSQQAVLVEGKGMSVLGSLAYPFRGCSWDTVRSEAIAYDEAKALETPGQTPRRSDR